MQKEPNDLPRENREEPVTTSQVPTAQQPTLQSDARQSFIRDFQRRRKKQFAAEPDEVAMTAAGLSVPSTCREQLSQIIAPRRDDEAAFQADKDARRNEEVRTEGPAISGVHPDKPMAADLAVQAEQDAQERKRRALIMEPLMRRRVKPIAEPVEELPASVMVAPVTDLTEATSVPPQARSVFRSPQEDEAVVVQTDENAGMQQKEDNKVELLEEDNDKEKARARIRQQIAARAVIRSSMR